MDGTPTKPRLPHVQRVGTLAPCAACLAGSVFHQRDPAALAHLGVTSQSPLRALLCRFTAALDVARPNRHRPLASPSAPARMGVLGSAGFVAGWPRSRRRRYRVPSSRRLETSHRQRVHFAPRESARRLVPPHRAGLRSHCVAVCRCSAIGPPPAAVNHRAYSWTAVAGPPCRCRHRYVSLPAGLAGDRCC
jgi:hypothetical protein